MTPLEQERLEILQQSVQQRAREVMYHQINIDNYRLAIAEIEARFTDDKDMAEFADHLRGLLASSIREQAKEQLMFTVIQSQLE